jgi:hypothetical protein
MPSDSPFPSISITGGPHGRNVEMRKDGERIKGVTRFELTGDVNDVLRLKTFQIIRAVVDLHAEHEHAVVVNVLAMREEGREGKIVVVGEELIATSTADTVWQALYDCARQLELTARKDGQGVAQAGTIVEPSGRPPGQ